MSVHLIGVGAMGSLVAHELVHAHPYINKNFTLLFKNLQAVDSFRSQDSKLVVHRRDNHPSFSTFHAEHELRKGDAIENLIVACKVHQTEAAIRKYVGNITPDTNIVILQNGMGMADTLKAKYWPMAENRPRMYQCISTHGAFKLSPFACNHVGLGQLQLARVPDQFGPDLTLSSIAKNDIPPAIVDLFTSTNTLHASYLEYPAFLLKQIEKLVVNTCINPLTAVFNCLNGELLHSSTLPQLMRRVIREDVRVLKHHLPILSELPETETYLDVERLLTVVIDVCRTTAANSSSMREDVRLLKPTEIYHLNGYINYLARLHKMQSPVNYLLEQMVNEKLTINRSHEKVQINTIVASLREKL